MKKEEFKRLFDGFNGAWDVTKADKDEMVRKWKGYSDDILSGSGLPLNKWLKSGNADYLPAFIEGTKTCGRARIGNYEQVMIYRNTTPGDERYGKYFDRYISPNMRSDRKREYYKTLYTEKEEVVERHYNDHVIPLLRHIVEVRTLDALYTLERDDDYKTFSAKQLLRKITQLVSFSEDDCQYSDGLAWIFQDESIDSLVDIFFGENEEERPGATDTFFQKNHAVYIRAKAWAKGENAKLSFEEQAKLNSFLWSLTKSGPEVGKTTSSPNLNTVFYGAPGTGKTYHTVNQAVAICENKSLETINKDYPVRDDLTKRYRELLESGHISFVTFHQSYTYEDFVIGIFPDFKSGSLNYVTKSGSFKRLCDLAKEDSDHNYVMIIDEINRGNISKIFGELITLIEKSKRLGEPEKTEVTLPYPDENGIDKFSVPGNVYIIGTMNTADRSIQHVDTALRRRFVFTEMVPNAALFHDLNIADGSKAINLEKLLNGINKRIKRYYDREHVIGHAYFTEMLKEGLNDKEKLTLLASIFHDKIIPLLQDYFFEDYSKIQKVLGEEEDTDEGKSLIRKLSSEPSDEEDEGHDVYEIAPVGDPAYENLDTYLLMIEK